MERDTLHGYLERGLSLPEIGALTGRDPSTVGYWVRKHGLVANGRDTYAPRGGLTRAELEPLVARGETLQSIADQLDRSVSTVRHWLRVHGLSMARHRGNRAAALEAQSAGLSRFEGSCRHHGPSEFLVFANGRSRCARCNAEAVARRRRKVKRLLVREAGGRCVVCGYDRYVGALHFHHTEPGRKEFSLSHQGVTRSLEKARREAAKCVLLCSNCHAEIESGVCTLPGVSKQAVA